MITQSLIWEELEILDQNRQWFKVKLFDDYEGWIHQFYIVKKHSKNNNSATYIETKPFGQILIQPKSNSIPILNCPFGVSNLIRTSTFFVASNGQFNWCFYSKKEWLIHPELLMSGRRSPAA